MKPAYLFAIMALIVALSVGPSRRAEAATVKAGNVTRVEVNGRDVTITVPFEAAGPARIYEWTQTDPATGEKTVRYADKIPAQYRSEKDFLSDATIAPEVLTRKAIAELWENAANQIWNDAFKGPGNPYAQCLHLKLEAKVKDVDTDAPLDSKWHRIHILHQKAPVTQASGGILCAGRDPWQAACDGDFDPLFFDRRKADHVAHEVGHLLGFHDEYAEVTTNPARETAPLPCRYHTLMADGGPPDCELIRRLVEKIRALTNDFNHDFPNDCPKNPDCKSCERQKPACPEPKKAGEIDLVADALAFNKLGWGTYEGTITYHQQWTAQHSNGKTTAIGTEDWTIGVKFWSQCEPGGCRPTHFEYNPTPTQGLAFGKRAVGSYTGTRQEPLAQGNHFTMRNENVSGSVIAVDGYLRPDGSHYYYAVAARLGAPPGGSRIFPPRYGLPVAEKATDCASALAGGKSIPDGPGAFREWRWQFAYTPLEPGEWPEWDSYNLPKPVSFQTAKALRDHVYNAILQAKTSLQGAGQNARAAKLMQDFEVKFQYSEFEKRWETLWQIVATPSNEAQSAWEDSTDDSTYQAKVTQLKDAVKLYNQKKQELEKLYAERIDQLAAQIQGPPAQKLRELAQTLRKGL